MRNITVSIADDLYRRTRIVAAEQDTTVTAMVRQFLKQAVSGDLSRARRRTQRLPSLAASLREDPTAPTVEEWEDA